MCSYRVTGKPATHWGKVAGCCGYATTQCKPNEACAGHMLLGHRALANAQAPMSLASSGQSDGMLEIARAGTRITGSSNSPERGRTRVPSGQWPECWHARGAPMGGVQASHCSVAPQAANKPATHWGKAAGCCGYATAQCELNEACAGHMLLGHRALANMRALVSLASSGQNAGMLVVVGSGT